MKRLLAAALVAAILPAFAADERKAADVEVTLERGAVHEACEHLAKGQSRHYRWRASAPVDFNVHYHEGSEVFFPVKRDGIGGDRGTFTAKVEQDYCWMWTARSAPATVKGRIGGDR